VVAVVLRVEVGLLRGVAVVEGWDSLVVVRVVRVVRVVLVGWAAGLVVVRVAWGMLRRMGEGIRRFRDREEGLEVAGGRVRLRVRFGVGCSLGLRGGGGTIGPLRRLWG
jgi:hypothetical protein